MAVEEQKPRAPVAPHRQHAAEQDRAVAAEHDRELAMPPRPHNRIGQRTRIVGDPLWVQEFGRRVAPWIVRRRLDPAEALRAKTLGEPRVEQRLRQSLYALWKQAEDRWRLDDRERDDVRLSAAGGRLRSRTKGQSRDADSSTDSRTRSRSRGDSRAGNRNCSRSHSSRADNTDDNRSGTGGSDNRHPLPRPPSVHTSMLERSVERTLAWARRSLQRPHLEDRGGSNRGHA